MRNVVSSSNEVEQNIQALERRARTILKARPAYRQLVDFYLTVFRRQIEWSDLLVVNPEPIDPDQRRECLGAGQPLIERFDPGLESVSLHNLWTEMKAVFRRGNVVLRQAVDQITTAEEAGTFLPASWLLELRPDRHELVADAAREVAVDESLLATLARAATLPHWTKVARAWLGRGRVDDWRRFECPACGGPPGLAEDRVRPSTAEGISGTRQRIMHCPFCATQWVVPTLQCPACNSTRPSDAQYYYTAKEPELSIDFCNQCKHYVKVFKAEQLGTPIHVGLELLTTSHLDALAQDNDLRPLNVCP